MKTRYHHKNSTRKVTTNKKPTKHLAGRVIVQPIEQWQVSGATPSTTLAELLQYIDDSDAYTYMGGVSTVTHSIVSDVTNSNSGGLPVRSVTYRTHVESPPGLPFDIDHYFNTHWVLPHCADGSIARWDSVNLIAWCPVTH